MDGINVAAEHADADAGFVELLADIISQSWTKLARRSINILNSLGQSELHEINIMGLQG
ncbi:hypothetical protein D3C85_1633640 [compost metagenome]